MKALIKIMVLLFAFVSLFGVSAFASASMVKTIKKAQLYQTASTKTKAEKAAKGKKLIAKSSSNGYVKVLYNNKTRYIKVSKIRLFGKANATMKKTVTSLKSDLKTKSTKFRKNQKIVISGVKQGYFKTGNVYIDAKYVNINFEIPETANVIVNKTPQPSSTPQPLPSPTPSPNHPYADIWLWFALEPVTIYPQKTTLNGTAQMGFMDTVIKVSVNGKVLEEKVFLGYTKEFSIDVDFSECKPGDEIVVSSDYIGDRSNPNLAIWKGWKTLIIE